VVVRRLLDGRSSIVPAEVVPRRSADRTSGDTGQDEIETNRYVAFRVYYNVWWEGISVKGPFGAAAAGRSVDSADSRRQCIFVERSTQAAVGS
jgi:hypothetical protein